MRLSASLLLPLLLFSAVGARLSYHFSPIGGRLRFLAESPPAAQSLTSGVRMAQVARIIPQAFSHHKSQVEMRYDCKGCKLLWPGLCRFLARN